MSDTTALPGPRLPEATARILVDSINAAHARGLTVRATSERGVICVSSHATERWAPRPKSRGVSPTGAAILFVQPTATNEDVAATVALQVTAPWLMGFEAGVAGELPHAVWADHVACMIIGEGYQLGRQVRNFVMLEECAVHRIQHRKGPCPLCAEAASGDAGPTPYDRQAGVIGAVPTRERR